MTPSATALHIAQGASGVVGASLFVVAAMVFVIVAGIVAILWETRRSHQREHHTSATRDGRHMEPVTWEIWR